MMTRKEQALESLDGSIVHWEKICTKGVKLDGLAKYGENCPCCKIYILPRERYCIGCPIHWKTGEQICNGTPWGDTVYPRIRMTKSGPYKYNLAMRNFLKDLRNEVAEVWTDDGPPESKQEG